MAPLLHRAAIIIITSGQSNLTKGHIAAIRGQHSIYFTMATPPLLKLSLSMRDLDPI